MLQGNELPDKWRDVTVALSGLLGDRDDLGVHIHIPQLAYDYRYNADKLFPAASVIKLAILSTMVERVRHGTIDLKEAVTIECPASLSEDPMESSGVLPFIESSCTLTLRELVGLMLLVSDNVAADVLVERIGKESVNVHISELGLGSTRLNCGFRKSLVLDEPGVNPTTPSEMLELLKHLQMASTSGAETFLRLLEVQVFRDRLPRRVGSDVVVRNKTGTLSRSGLWVINDVAILIRGSRTGFVTFFSARQFSYEAVVDCISEVGAIVAQAMR